MKRFIRVVVPCVLVLWFGLAYCAPSGKHDDAFSDEGLLQANADELDATYVSPHLDATINDGKNVLWCGTFQLAWNEVCTLVGEDLHFTNEDVSIVAPLNEKAFTKDDLDEACYVAIADFVRNDVHGKIRRALKRKFGGRASPHHLPSRDPGQDIVSYAYLFKNLEFETPFERLDDPLDFGGTSVSCFGVGRQHKPGHAKILPQVQILFYESPDDFAVELETKAEGDRLILAKIQPEKTLGETIAKVHDRATETEPQPAQPGDVLTVPKLNFDVTRRFRELEGRRLVVSNPRIANYLVLSIALQNVRFQLDEKGVRLRSEAHITFGCSAPARPMPRHVMVFDRPFLILLQRADAETPYFALWVDNPELLVAAD